MASNFYFENWPEIIFFVLLVLGILISVILPSAFVSYLVIFISGMLAGRLIYERKHKLKFPYFLLVIGFLIGYLLGAYYSNRKVILILFIIGAMLSYELYEKKIIHDFQF